jgi:hypothetical protein
MPDELELGRTILLFLWCSGLAGIEIEIEGGSAGPSGCRPGTSSVAASAGSTAS